MAEEKEEDGSASILFAFIVLGVILVIAWFAFGGPERGDLRNIILTPPPAPQIIIPEEGGSGRVVSPSSTSTTNQ